MSEIVFAPEWDNVEQRRAILVDFLANNDCMLTFKKVDGELRDMPCTLRADALPPAPVVVEGRASKKPNPDVLSVWCLDKKEWRSLRLINAIKCTVINNENPTS